jgi:hypothetical protein
MKIMGHIYVRSCVTLAAVENQDLTLLKDSKKILMGLYLQNELG